VVVVAMVYRELAQRFTRKLAAATSTDVGEQGKRTLAVAL
jgi:hypothetical protein